MITKFKGEFRWLSNFYPVPVVLDGMTFASVEHAYVAAKTLDPQVRERIRRLPTASQAKRYGRKIGKSIPFRPAWSNEIRIRLMRDLLWQKFTEPDLRQRLIATGDEKLIESGHWHDVFFGVCSCPKCGGKGLNWLGVLLMEIRGGLRAKEASMAVAEGRLRDAA